MGQVTIINKDYTTVQTVSSISIEPGQISLNESARFPVKLLDSNGALIAIEFVEMSGAEYDSWGSSDDYVTNLILTKLGMVKK